MDLIFRKLFPKPSLGLLHDFLSIIENSNFLLTFKYRQHRFAISMSEFQLFSQLCCNGKKLEVISKLGPFARTCNPSKWEADIWGWLEVRRSAMFHYTVNQRPHWACWQYGHSGGTRGWLGVERCQLCMQDTSRSTKWHRRAAVGHWIS